MEDVIGCEGLLDDNDDIGDSDEADQIMDKSGVVGYVFQLGLLLWIKSPRNHWRKITSMKSPGRNQEKKKIVRYYRWEEIASEKLTMKTNLQCEKSPVRSR